MKYHYQRGTGKSVRHERMKAYGAASLIAIAACTGMLALRSDRPASNNSVHQAPGAVESSLPAEETAAKPFRHGECGRGEKHVGLDKSSAAQLRKLAEYETVCGGSVADKMSFFVPLPTTTSQAGEMAQYTASMLKEFARFGVQPIVFLEPNTLEGKLANIDTFRSGGYDASLDAYFAAIKAEGVTDASMGTWVPLPEWNIPVWGNTDPGVFVNLFTRTVQLQKKHFPQSRASILLESKTYPAGNSWEDAAYVSLLPYVQGIPKGLVDSFGMQGFPWGATDSDQAFLDPGVYLRSDLAIDAAKAIGASEIWFNTGTFGYFANNAQKPSTLSPDQRRDMLNGAVKAAQSVKAAGLSSAIHLFAVDKSDSEEKIDWSYWKEGNMNGSPFTPIFKDFVRDAGAAGVSLWLYDSQSEG